MPHSVCVIPVVTQNCKNKLPFENDRMNEDRIIILDRTPSSSPESGPNTLSFLATTCSQAWQEGSQLPYEGPVGSTSSMFQLWSNDVAPNSSLSAHQMTFTMPKMQFPGHMQSTLGSHSHHHHHHHHHHHELPLTPPAEPPSAYSFDLSPVKMLSSQAQGNVPYYTQHNAVGQNFPSFLQNASGRPHLPGGHVEDGQQWWSLPQSNSAHSGHPFSLGRQLVLGHQPQIAALLQGTSKVVKSEHEAPQVASLTVLYNGVDWSSRIQTSN
ncbi:hypothetical protein cypCar_00004981 [Cyprinus carpio]|nr:hypothetical protein cypCar_00004981 [Cyprinus carpio]